MSEIDLPDVFPQSPMVVQDEPHRFVVYEKIGGGDNPKREYTLDKAPVISIVTVTGTSNGSETEFEGGGVDYELSQDDERIVWQGNDEPDDDTRFYVTYRVDPVIQRYTAGVGEEYDSVEEGIITSAVEGKFVDSADSEELDQLGSLFGPVLGARRGRDTEEYRKYLKSVVQSFISRGTVDGIKLAVSAATDVDVDNITVNEDFTNNEYEVILDEGTDASAQLVNDIAEIADPSGVKQIKPRIDAATDTVGVDDSVTITEGDILQSWNEVNSTTVNWADEGDGTTDGLYWA
jgi:hypothetical protein